MKDNFSGRSDLYAKYRPVYPAAFYAWLRSAISNPGCAWDCATGNGQVAAALADFFDQVYATDISEQQLAQAPQMHNITYSLQSAEQTDFADQRFDLIITAQAIHWFVFEKFYEEVKRTGKKDGLVVALGYGLIETWPALDAVISAFYTDVIGPYWDKERKYIDEHYQTIPFPFEEIEAPAFVQRLQWSTEHLIGYLNTWSAVKHFITANGYNPVDQIVPSIEKYWGDEVTKEVCFPLLLRVGRIG